MEAINKLDAYTNDLSNKKEAGWQQEKQQLLDQKTKIEVTFENMKQRYEKLLDICKKQKN